VLSLERFATIRAEIEGARDRDRVLEAVGLIPREWLSIERHRLNAIAKEVAAGRTELSNRFLVSFSAALPEVSLATESMALAPPAAATVEPAAAAVPAIADPPAVKRVLASFQVGSAPALRSPEVDRWSLEQYAALARAARTTIRRGRHHDEAWPVQCREPAANPRSLAPAIRRSARPSTELRSNGRRCECGAATSRSRYHWRDRPRKSE